MLTRTIGAALRPLSPTFRRAVRAELARRGQPSAGPLNTPRRLALEDALFAVVNALEHRRHDHPQVRALHAVRAVLLDEVPVASGGNETRDAGHWPLVDAVAAVMRERRRTGSADAFRRAA